MIRRKVLASALGILCSFFSCQETVINCDPKAVFDTSRGPCTVSLSQTPTYSENTNAVTRTISTNSIPNHMVGVFGGGAGSLGPTAIQPRQLDFGVTMNPTVASSVTQLLSNNGPAYSFGVLLNGIQVDPIAAEPWPHTNMMDPNVNWTWNLEASNVRIGLDCNNAHVQPQGKYHYHGIPELYIPILNPSTTAMTLIGWAADGFPIYYKYGHSDASNSSSSIMEMTSSYRLKTGDRPGDGVSAPCGTYDGIYSNDYEYVSGLGTLDECNGRTGVTPEFPNGTYYYVLTATFPHIPRCFKGTPSTDFRI